jgi:hypothetical protein
MDCTHLDQINDVTPSADGCEDCLKIGDTWVHLRLCMTCGRGLLRLFKEQTRHQTLSPNEPSIIKSFQPGEVGLVL